MITKIGLIGCGGVSGAHVPCYLAIPEQAKVIATCDVVEKNAQERAKALGAEAWYTDYHELLKRDDIDAVDICLPHHLHAPVAVSAAKAKKHAIVEKPMCTTLAEADEMINAAEENGVKLMVAQCQRFDPGNVKVKELIESGAIGDVFCARADCNQHLTRGDWLHSNKEAGGGVVISVAVHKLDLLRWFLGDVKRVAAFQKSALGTMEGEDASVASLEFEGGAVGEMVSLYAAKRAPWGEYLILYGTKGVIHNIGGLQIYSENVPEWSSGFARIEAPAGNAFANEIKHFVECIQNDEEPLTSGKDNRKTMEVIIGIYKSAEEGRVVELPL